MTGTTAVPAGGITRVNAAGRAGLAVRVLAVGIVEALQAGARKRVARCTAPGLEWNRAARRPNGSVKREQNVPHSLENAIVFSIN